MPGTELHALPAVELSRAYAAGTVSPVDVARAVVAQVERWEPHLHATTDFDADEALVNLPYTGRVAGPLSR